MVSFAPCKINLGLHIVRKREDGFHEIDTCFYPVPWYDVVEVVTADKFSFHQTGIPVPGPAAENLCVRAYVMLRDQFDLPPVQVYLHKIIPIGAGLGGGSSDAAHILIVLNELFTLNLSPARLAEYAARLGSDCAFFAHGQPMHGTGRGEVLTPVSVSLEGKWLLIVKPAIHIATAVAYTMATPQVPPRTTREILENIPAAGWRGVLKNDFEAPLFAQYPAIGDIRKALYDAGAFYASLSGSGSAVFGLFDQPAGYPGSIHGLETWSGTLH